MYLLLRLYSRTEVSRNSREENIYSIDDSVENSMGVGVGVEEDRSF